MNLKITNEEIEAIKYYVESKFLNINQLLNCDSRTDIAFLSDEENEGIHLSYSKDSVVKYLEVIKNIYSAIYKVTLMKEFKGEWNYVRKATSLEIEKFKNEPYIDRFMFASLNLNSFPNTFGSANGLTLKIKGRGNIPNMNLDDIFNTTNNNFIIAPFTKVVNVEDTIVNKDDDIVEKTYTLTLEKQSLEHMEERDKLELYNHIILNSDRVNSTLQDAVFLEKENTSNYESIRELEKQIDDFEQLIFKKEEQKDYSQSEKKADEQDLLELNEKLEIFKNRSAEIFNSIKNNNNFMTQWKKNITIYLMAEFYDIERKLDAEYEAELEIENEKKEILVQEAKTKKLNLEKESFENIVEEVKKECKNNIINIEKLIKDINRLIERQQIFAKIASNVGANYAALNNGFEMKKKAEILQNLVDSIRIKVELIESQAEVVIGSEKLVKISEVNNQIAILLNYLNNPKTISAKNTLTRFEEIIVVEENELKRNIAKTALNIRGEAELKKLKDDVEIIEEKTPFKRFLGVFTGQNKLDEFILDQIDIRENTIKKALSKELRLDYNYSIHELVAEIRMFIEENKDDELVVEDIKEIEALEHVIENSFVIIDSKVKDIIDEKERKNLPVTNKISKKEMIEIETYRFLSKYGYDKSNEYSAEEAVYKDTLASEITRIIEYINTSKIIDI